MQAYNCGFARIYNQKWVGFAQHVAPKILDFYANIELSRHHKSVLDLCCGTGQLAHFFLENGYRVTGIDLSKHMLKYAIENTAQYIESGQACFIEGDASCFQLQERFGLVVSTFDALNHLHDIHALKSCFECVRSVCDGIFVFDLNTRHGLNRWNSFFIDESREDMLIITQGIYDGISDKAWTRINGFIQVKDGLYQRFEETSFNTAFNLTEVKSLLLDVGWKAVYFARLEDLNTSISDPENENRIFVIAR